MTNMTVMMQKHLPNVKIGVVGATGMVGQEMLNILAQYGVPKTHVRAFASERSAGKRVRYGHTGRYLTVQDAYKGNYRDLNVVLLAVDADKAQTLAFMIRTMGPIVIDNSSHFRMDKEIPLVVPEINGHDLKMAGKSRIIANPNCATIQMLMVLAPLHREFTVQQVFASTYQSVSGAGKAGVETLERQRTKAFEYNQGFGPFSTHIDLNVIPQIGSFCLDEPFGYFGEEVKMFHESRKILGHSRLKVSATCVRVPIMRGHMVDVRAKFQWAFTIPEIRELLKMAPGVYLEDDASRLSPLSVVDGENDDVAVGRLRHDAVFGKKGLAFVCTADNVRKGAALNAVQIAAML